MNYYEKLVRKISQAMAKDPQSAMVMDMGSFKILAKGSSITSLRKKLPALQRSRGVVVFQKSRGSWVMAQPAAQRELDRSKRKHGDTRRIV